jgi:hypothetical protein
MHAVGMVGVMLGVFVACNGSPKPPCPGLSQVLLSLRRCGRGRGPAGVRLRMALYLDTGIKIIDAGEIVHRGVAEAMRTHAPTFTAFHTPGAIPSKGASHKVRAWRNNGT